MDVVASGSGHGSAKKIMATESSSEEANTGNSQKTETKPCHLVDEQEKRVLSIDNVVEPVSKVDQSLMAKLKFHEKNDYLTYLKQLRHEGRQLRSDGEHQPKFSEKPDWLDEQKIARAKRVYSEHFMAINFASLTGLLLLVRIDSIHRTLKATGASDSCAKLFKRYYDTLNIVKKWFEGDLLSSDDDAHRSLQIVRGMHNKVSSKFNDKQDWNQDELKDDHHGVCPAISSSRLINHDGQDNNNNDCDAKYAGSYKHISQYDIMITQFAFVGLIVTHPQRVGLLDKFSPQDLESILHFWRLIGHYLGVSKTYNLCSYQLEDVIGLCKALNEFEYKRAINEHDIKSDHGLMSLNIARAVKFIPMITFYGMMKHAYKMLNQDVEEFEYMRNWYTGLSYYFIELVMCRLLAYKPLRVFNNGLIRLSVYLVGQLKDWFTNHLESSHGPQLGP